MYITEPRYWRSRNANLNMRIRTNSPFWKISTVTSRSRKFSIRRFDKSAVSCAITRRGEFRFHAAPFCWIRSDVDGRNSATVLCEKIAECSCEKCIICACFFVEFAFLCCARGASFVRTCTHAIANALFQKKVTQIVEIKDCGGEVANAIGDVWKKCVKTCVSWRIFSVVGSVLMFLWVRM